MEIKVRGFSLPEVENPYNDLPFTRIRKFQKDFIEGVVKDKFDVFFLSAPTGAGKTLCFEYLCRKKLPVLLIYPTTALMEDQERQFRERGVSVYRLDSTTLGDERGYLRSRKLLTLFQRHRIIITNPDIISAILHHLYVNPEEDLIRIFNYFNFIIYDEFHIYKELELSEILLQSILFLNCSKAKVVFSSATPSFDFIEILEEIQPQCKIRILEEKSGECGSLVRHDTKVYITNEKFKEKVVELIKSCIEKRLKTLVMCNSNKFARELYNILVTEHYVDYVTKDTGDETRGEIKADREKLIIVSTSSKSEIGIDYPLDVIIIDVAPDIRSFIQRFGRVSRKKEGIAYIFVKNSFSFGNETEIEYYEFIEKMRNYFLEKSLSEKLLKSILEFRVYLVLHKYTCHFKRLSGIFSDINWKKYYMFFKELEKSKEKLSKLGIGNKDLDFIIKFLDDYKKGLSLLRGISVTARIKYQRGEDWSFTSYDLLHSLNNYEVQIDENYITLLESSEKSMIHSVIYNNVPYDFYKFDQQLKNEVCDAWDRLANLHIVQKDHRNMLREILRVDLRRIILPEEIILRDGRRISVKKYIKTSSESESIDLSPSNII
ncbi:MAG: type I-D CRISPR-associated helicase Cas3' [Thermoplasmatales archaeon]|nr:type I-D CRISPR-associated helicase Cas3' [Thermoplasmatales archaeon]